MVEDSGESAPRRRVRTGCLTCRGRRRKCDEGKPQCQNCRTKNLHCRYGLNITFVGSKKKAGDETEKHGGFPNTRIHSSDTPTDDLQVTQAAASSLELNPRGERSFLDESVVEEPSQNASQSQLLSTSLGDASNLVQDHRVPKNPSVQLFSGSTFEPFRQDIDSSLASPPSAAVSRSWDNFARPEPGSADALVLPSRPSVLDILTYYRYNTAVQIDLGVGEEYFGVRVLRRAAHCLRIQRSILALASYQRALSGSFRRPDDEIASFEYATAAEAICEDADEQEDILVSQTLLTLRSMIMNAPHQWENDAQGICGSLASLPTGELEELWHLIARLCLAARLMAKHPSPIAGLSFLSRSTVPIFAGQQLSKKQQLGQILSVLERTLLLSSSQNRPQLARNIPVAAEWQSCWSNSQLWCAARSDDMQQILALESSPGSHDDVGWSILGFPTLIFSNACALVANVVYHLTSLLLLQHKPRLVKAMADSGSSTSAQWHALRVIGIVASSDSSSVWNPLVAAAVIRAAKSLSHPSQLRAVADLLRGAVESSGMNLQDEIQRLEGVEYSF
ncbi:uncharacterized protein PV07_01234 [Cladophialophora immunda]|uniref:Zn(2)-C6 fungal-type domain-containing protein n=1 Tax=Cladophialophora immunda TaxID=569365 RepID=A0A0D2A2A9_9EURO|nr:uncharacterized protein PV07_01234 [Cladophialophora immunda]KIW34456.1 hypothetical protein PV07_01234 [Cladophialophora immunda]